MAVNQDCYWYISEKHCLSMTQPLWFCLGSHMVRAKRRRLRVSEDCWLDFQESENHYRVDAGYGQVMTDFHEKKMPLKCYFPF